MNKPAREIPRVLVRMIANELPHAERNVIIPPLETRLERYLGYHPSSKYLDSFTISFTSDDNANGVKLAESMRRKYKFVGDTTLVGVTQNRAEFNRNFPLFRRIPRKSIIFCAQVLESLAAGSPVIHVPFGRAYLVEGKQIIEGKQNTTKFLGFELESLAMESLYDVLKAKFRPIKEEFSKSTGVMRGDDGKDPWRLWTHDTDGTPLVIADWFPRIKVAEVEDDAKAHAILQDLRRYEGRGYSLSLTGLCLHMLPRIEVWKRQGGINMGKQYLGFPFDQGKLDAPRVMAPDPAQKLMDYYLKNQVAKKKEQPVAPVFEKFSIRRPISDRFSTPYPQGQQTYNLGARRIQLRQNDLQETETEQKPSSSERDVPHSNVQFRDNSMDDPASTTSQQRSLVRRLLPRS